MSPLLVLSRGGVDTKKPRRNAPFALYGAFSGRVRGRVLRGGSMRPRATVCVLARCHLLPCRTQNPLAT